MECPNLKAAVANSALTVGSSSGRYWLRPEGIRLSPRTTEAYCHFQLLLKTLCVKSGFTCPKAMFCISAPTTALASW